MLRVPKSLDAGIPAGIPTGILGRAGPGPLALVALAALAVVFLAGLFGEDGRWTLSSAGRLQEGPLSRVDPPARVLGAADPAAAYRSEPWAAFDRREIREVRAPVWDPWNACGRPHLANAGTASFSPFALAGTFFDARTGAVVTAALELFALALFAYLFLRELEASVVAALVGATAFAFAGAQLQPLATARAGALAALPAALLFAEKTIRIVHRVALESEGERRTSARVLGPLAGLCLTFALGSLCGSPAAIAIAGALTVAWTLARGSAIAFAARADGRDLRALRVAGSKMAFALLLAAGMASFRILGWLELLAHADTAPPLAELPARISLAPWPLHVFPNALGESAAAAIAPVHVGGVVLFLALLAVVFARRDARIAWFAAFGLVCLATASGAAPVLAKLAALGVPSDEAGQGGWALCAACAAALGLDRIADTRSSRPWARATLIALAGVLFLAAFRLGLERLAGFDAASVSAHLRRMAIAFATGLVALSLLVVAREAWTRLAAGAGLVLAVFLGGGRALAYLVPRCEERAVFAETPSLRALRAKIGADRIAILGEDALPPDANAAYEIATPTSRGGTEIDAFSRLFRRAFESEVRGPIRKVSERALACFGVRWVLAHEPFELADRRPDAFQRESVIAGLTLFRYKRSLGKAWFVERSTRAESLERALELVEDEAFDPSRVVVLGPGDGEAERRGPQAEDRLEVALGTRVADLARPSDPPPRWTDVEPTWIRIEVECDATKYLVLAHTWFPGWRARVNGVETPLLRANAAFSAVEIPPGLSVVEMSYEPRSIEIGLWIGLASALVGLACLFRRPFD